MITADTLKYRKHAIQETLADRISLDDVLAVLNTGDVIRDYADDRPYPSRLMFAIVGGRPIHTVAAFDPATGMTWLITAYVPDSNRWESDWKTRKPRKDKS